MPVIKLFEKDTTKNPVNMEVFDLPTGVTPLGKSVVVAYGTDGLLPPSKKLIEDFCRDDLAGAGYTVALPRYFESTKTSPGLAGVSGGLTKDNLKLWTDAIVEAVKWCKTNQGNDNVALIGFSLGGYMAARTALATPVKLLIDFFGPMTRFGKNPITGDIYPFPSGEDITKGKAEKLPPTQIHHGKKDLIVLPEESEQLAEWRREEKLTVELNDKYTCGHPQQPLFPWTAVEQAQAKPAVLQFLKDVMP